MQYGNPATDTPQIFPRLKASVGQFGAIAVAENQHGWKYDVTRIGPARAPISRRESSVPCHSRNVASLQEVVPSLATAAVRPAVLWPGSRGG
jgi:hypothetical protein